MPACRRVGTNLQNAYMYLNSIGCNLGFLLVNGTLHEATHADNLRAVCSPTVLAIVAIMASVGMVTTAPSNPRSALTPTLAPTPTRAPAPTLTPNPNPNLNAEPDDRHPNPRTLTPSPALAR